MKIFVDTGAWIALADKNDKHHASAVEVYGLIRKRNIKLFITDYIFDETVTWLLYKIRHKVACDWGNRILNSRMVELVKVNTEHIHAAWKLFQKYQDQTFSFTDCLSFQIMEALDIKIVFAYDSHFSTVGFSVINKESAKSILD